MHICSLSQQRLLRFLFRTSQASVPARQLYLTDMLTALLASPLENEQWFGLFLSRVCMSALHTLQALGTMSSI